MKDGYMQPSRMTGQYQIQNARNVIRRYRPKIRIVEVVEARYLLFIKKDRRSKKVH